jgi:hypothetical protein
MDNFNINNEIIKEFDKIFNNLERKRTSFIEYINSTDISLFSKEELLNFMNDIREVTHPIRNSIESIDYLIRNNGVSNESRITNEKILKSLIILDYYS